MSFRGILMAGLFSSIFGLFSSSDAKAEPVKKDTEEYTVEIKEYPRTASSWREDRIQRNNQLLNTLNEHGDIANASREIEHWILFDELNNAEKFAEWTRSANFTECLLSQGKTETGDIFQVKCKHMGTLLRDDIMPFTLAIAEQANKYNGDYDGWETFVITGK